MASIEKQPTLTGERIYMRGVTELDVDGQYYNWMNDLGVLKFVEARFLENTKENLKETVAVWKDNPNIYFFAILLKENDRHIGNIKLGPIDQNHKFADIGIVIGEKDCWGEGYGKEALNLLTHFAFKELNLHKLTAGCYSNNVASAKLFQKSGFQLEGIRKSHYIFENKYVDAMLFGKINPDKDKEIQ